MQTNPTSHAKMKTDKMLTGKCVCKLNWTFVWISMFLYMKTICFLFGRFYLYKLPGRFEHSVYKRGCLYFFITPNSISSQWTLSELTLSDIGSMAGQTLSQAYFSADQVTEDRLLVAYNDEPPNAKGNSKKGHLKGVVVADKQSGFWLVHSVPLYPNISCELHILWIQKIYFAFLSSCMLV